MLLWPVHRLADMTIPAAEDVVATVVNEQREKLRRKDAVVQVFRQVMEKELEHKEGDWLNDLLPCLATLESQPSTDSCRDKSQDDAVDEVHETLDELRRYINRNSTVIPDLLTPTRNSLYECLSFILFDNSIYHD